MKLIDHWMFARTDGRKDGRTDGRTDKGKSKCPPIVGAQQLLVVITVYLND
jgi:hypothetical protein